MERAVTGAGRTESRLLAGETLFTWLLTRDDVAYLHVHNAKRGCYAARVERA